MRKEVKKIMEITSNLVAANLSNPKGIQAQSLGKSKDPNDLDFQREMSQLGAAFQLGGSQGVLNQVPQTKLGEGQAEQKIGQLKSQPSPVLLNPDDQKQMDQKQADQMQVEQKEIPSGTLLAMSNQVGPRTESKLAGLDSLKHQNNVMLASPELFEQSELPILRVRGEGIQKGMKHDHSIPYELGEHQELSGASGASISGLELMAANGLSGSHSFGQKPIQTHLSGGEFLSALNVVHQRGGDQKSASDFSDTHSGNEQGTQSQFGQNLVDLKAKKNKGVESEVKLNNLFSFDPAILPGNTVAVSGMAKPTELSAQVVPGAMSQPRFSTESLMGMSTGIRQLSLSGGGEIRIRLKPENLGELNLKVVANGNRIGLQIQASDEKAKKIIEESINYLKESLSAQNMTLAQVDLSVAKGSASSQNDSGNHSHHQQSQSGFQNDFGQNLNQGGHHQQSEQWSNSELGFDARSMGNRSLSGTSGARSSWPTSSQMQSLGGSGRLDVRG
jgi:hypothetical protein